MLIPPINETIAPEQKDPLLKLSSIEAEIHDHIPESNSFLTKKAFDGSNPEEL